MMNIQIKVGTRIKELRAEKDLSQEYLAFLSNRDKSYISGIELGKRNFSITVLDDLLKVLDTSIETFFSHPIFEETKE